MGKSLGLISVSCFGSFDDARHLIDEIDALNRASARPDPFSTFAFLENFSRHDEFRTAAGGMCLWFLTAFSGDRLIGYLALRKVESRVLGLATSTVGFLVTHDTDRPHLVALPENEQPVSEAFFAHLLTRASEWGMLEFQQQDPASALFPPPAQVNLKAYWQRDWVSLENCTLALTWPSLAAYFQALPKKYRTNLGRQMRKLLGAGVVELLGSADPAVTPALLELYRGIEAHSWKSQAKANIGRSRERIAYFEALLAPHQPMTIAIQILLLDGVPIAGIISGDFDKGLYALHIVYDDRVNPLAPGSAMLLMGVRRAIARQCDFFNLLSGSGYYKARWLAQTTETRVGQIYRIGGLLFWRRIVGDGLRWLSTVKASRVLVRFNPVRRKVAERECDAAEFDLLAPLQTPIDERHRIDELVAQVRRGDCEYLTGARLAEALPVDIKSAQAGKKKSAPQNAAQMMNAN
jgi:hypothetical protein